VPAYRSPVALSQVATAEMQYRMRLAVVLGAAAAISVAFLSGLFSGLAARDPEPSVEAAVLTGLAFTVVAIPVVAIPYLAHRSRYRALEVMYWAAIRSARHSAELTGERRIPATPAQAAAWLKRQPDTDAARSLRVYCQLLVGNMAEARDLAARLPDATARDRLVREASWQLIRIVEGEDPAPGRLRSLATELTTDADRLEADVDVSMLEALTAAADGRDWTPPLLALGSRIGAAADGALLRHFWLPVIGLLVVGGLALALVSYAVLAVLA
jgi:hypothetical protein